MSNASNFGGVCIETMFVCMASACVMGSRDGVIGVVTRLWEGRSGGEPRSLQNVQTGPVAHPACYSIRS